jgi:hypothetical protein
VLELEGLPDGKLEGRSTALVGEGGPLGSTDAEADRLDLPVNVGLVPVEVTNRLVDQE